MTTMLRAHALRKQFGPVLAVDGCAIGTGRPGPVTARLTAAFRARTAAEGTPLVD